MTQYPYYQPYMSQNRGQYGSFNYGMPSYAPQPQQTPVQAQNQTQMQPQYEMPIQDIRFVTSEEAKAFIVMPNTTVLLIDKSSGQAQLKSADQMGQSASKFFRFEEINADGSPMKPKEVAPQIDLNDFVKRSDLEKCGFVTTEQYKELSQKIENIQKAMVTKTSGTPKATI